MILKLILLSVVFGASGAYANDSATPNSAKIRSNVHCPANMDPVLGSAMQNKTQHKTLIGCISTEMEFFSDESGYPTMIWIPAQQYCHKQYGGRIASFAELVHMDVIQKIKSKGMPSTKIAIKDRLKLGIADDFSIFTSDIDATGPLAITSIKSKNGANPFTIERREFGHKGAFYCWVDEPNIIFNL